MITIRRIRPGEWELFREVRLASVKEAPQAFHSTYEGMLNRSQHSWQQQADASASGGERATFLALEQGKPVGITALYRDGLLPEQGELLQVWVAPEQRGSGLAVELIETVLAWGHRYGFRRVLAGVTAQNLRAVRFYERLGFTLDERHARSALGGVMLSIDLPPEEGQDGG